MLLPIVFGVSHPCRQLIVHVYEQGDLNLRQDGGRPFQIAVIPLLVLRQFCFRQELVCLKGMSGMGMLEGWWLTFANILRRSTEHDERRPSSPRRVFLTGLQAWLAKKNGRVATVQKSYPNEQRPQIADLPITQHPVLWFP